MNATVKVYFYLSDEYRRARLIEAGERLDKRQEIEIDLTTATEAERTAIINWAGIGLSDITISTHRAGDEWQNRRRTSDDLILDAVPTVTNVADHCIRMQMEVVEAQRIHDEYMLGKIQEDIAEKMQAMREHLADRTLGDVALRGYDLEQARKRLGVDLTEYNALHAQYAAWEAERRAELERQSEENKRQQEQVKAEKQAEKLAWVDAHGSDHLKRACAAGHDCNRLYWTERAALEYPGYMVDIENNAAWKSRSCPSVDALDERDAVLQTHPNVNVQIVWMTSQPSDRKLSDAEQYDDEFEACEALVVDDPDYPYDLVREF